MTGNLVHLKKHPRMQDVALHIFEETQSDLDPTQVELDVGWWNIGKCHSPYPMHVYQVLKVSHEWVQELKDYKYEGKSCGLPLK